MALRFDIGSEYEWHYGERKAIDIRVTDSDDVPVDLTEVGLTWRVARVANSTRPYIEKTTVDGIEVVAHEDDEYDVQSIARCNVDPEDYALFPRAGQWVHELRDNTNDLVLSYGKARILPAMSEAAT